MKTFTKKIKNISNYKRAHNENEDCLDETSSCKINWNWTFN